MTPDERAAAIAAKISAFFADGKTWSWKSSGVTFTLSNFAVIPGGIEVWVAASDANGPLPLDNPYRFVNPPTTTNGGANQEAAAAKAMVENAVLLVARQMGWNG